MIAPDARPRLARGVRLKPDPVRGGFNLLAPERVLRANASSAAILELCDGARTVAEIAALLAERYGADAARIEADATALIDGLVARRMVEP